MALVSMPRSSLLGGNASEFREDGLRFYESCERLGPLVEARLYHLKVYVVTGPDLLEAVLVTNARDYQKPRLLKELRIIFGDGLLTADGEHWRFRRKLLQPVLTTKRNAGYARIFVRNIARTVDRWTSGVRDVHPDLIDLCITNMTSALFGVEDATLNRRIADLAAYCHELTTEMGTYRFPLYNLVPPIVDLRFGARVRELEEGIVDLVRSLRGESEREGGCGALDDVFGRLVASNDRDGCPMGRKGVRDETFTMFLGQSFVTIEDALILATIVQRFDFALAGPEVLPFEGLTLLPAGGKMVLRLSERTRAPHGGRARSAPLSSSRLRCVRPRPIGSARAQLEVAGRGAGRVSAAGVAQSPMAARRAMFAKRSGANAGAPKTKRSRSVAVSCSTLAVTCSAKPATPTTTSSAITASVVRVSVGLGQRMHIDRKPIPSAAAATGTHSLGRKKPFCAWSRTESPKFPTKPPSARKRTQGPKADVSASSARTRRSRSPTPT